MPVSIEVNGEAHVLDVEPTRRLLAVLRDDLALTGTKHGCGEGACGACAVLLDGRPVGGRDRKQARRDGAALQDAFVTEDALQCGFCTPGQIVSAAALVAQTPEPTSDEIRHRMAGNLCRCGTYPRIEEAISTWRS